MLPLILLKTSWGFYCATHKKKRRFISLLKDIWRWSSVFFFTPEKGSSVSGVTCFLSLTLLPQYWRACPSQPALLNAAHGSSVKPTSVTTPTASPSPLMPRLSRCLSYASWPPLCMQHDPCHPNPTPPLQLLWTNFGPSFGCLCSPSEDSYQASGDRSQPNLFAWCRSTWENKSCTACQHIFLKVKNMLMHSRYNQPWL